MIRTFEHSEHSEQSRCLGSLVVAPELMERLEVLVVNDGSMDRTSEIAHEFAAKWPETFRVIDKYGSCVSGGALPISTGEAFDRAVRELLPDVHAAIEDNTIGRGAPFHFVREWRKDYSRNTWRFKVFRLQGNFSQ